MGTLQSLFIKSFGSVTLSGSVQSLGKFSTEGVNRGNFDKDDIIFRYLRGKIMTRVYDSKDPLHTVLLKDKLSTIHTGVVT